MKLASQIATTLGIALAVTGISTSVANADQITVKSGDTLSSIAAEHQTTVDDLAQINQLADINVLYVGQTLETDANYLNTQPVATTPAAQVAQAPVVTTAPSVATTPAKPVVQRTASVAPTTTNVATPTKTNVAASGSTKSQFIANGGTEALWNSVVMPESGGNANATSPNGYHGLGQTKQAWGSGSVADQTKGLVNYATSRYGSIDNAIQFRQAHNWW